MINLLPYDLNRQTRAARMNTILIRYIIILGSAIGFLALVSGTTYLFLVRDKEIIKETKPVVSASSVQGKINSFNSSLTISKNILDQHVTYSDILVNLGAILPKGAILNSLTLSDSSFGAITNLSLSVSSATVEPTIKESLTKSSQFTNYKLLSTTGGTGDYAGYPITLNISMTINKGVIQ